MAKLKGYKKPLSSFFSWSKDEQAEFIERETKNVIKRLPKLKSALQMYGEVSDELYNMSSEELQLIGTTYSRAVRSGEISTPSSKRAYQNFIGKLKKYSRMSIKELAEQTAEMRLQSWLDHVRANGSTEEIAYAEKLIGMMTEEDKIGFTRSKYFLDTENWSSEGFVQELSSGVYSIQVLKLELYMQDKGYVTDNLYFTEVNTSISSVKDLRAYHLEKFKRKG